MIVYEIYRNRYKELFITAQSNGVPYQDSNGTNHWNLDTLDTGEFRLSANTKYLADDKRRKLLCMWVSGDMSLSNTDIHNLLVFLERVQLTGGEAVTFVQLVQKLQNIGSDANADCDKSGQDAV